MKKLIIILGLFVCLNAVAENSASPSWQDKLKSFVTNIVGAEWGQKLFGDSATSDIAEIAMPEIPKQVKKNTDVDSYTKKSKGPTEFDKLPLERRRQFDYQFIKELFLVTRKTDAKDEDLSNWLNTLDQGGSREGIYQGLVLDEVYNGLESIGGKPTKKLLDFCLKFSQKYLKQTFKPESLNQLNLYSLKRIFTEKGLDLMEYYEVKDLDALYRWYAIFSAELANDFQPMLLSDVRKDQSAKFHYQWAQSMPIQHIKSEFIIKLHTVMNGLQLLNQE